MSSEPDKDPRPDAEHDELGPDAFRLDADVRIHLRDQARLNAPPSWELPLDQVRASDRAAYAVDDPTPVSEVRELELPGPAGSIPARLYRPEGGDSSPGVVVLLHGGGFVLGDIEIHDEAGRRTCAGAGALVVSVDYRLAPEHPFPAAVEDAVAATRWIAEQSAELGGDPSRIIVSGDSAGGNLAAVVARRLRDENGPQLIGQALIYPTTDLRPDQYWPSRRELANGYGLTQDAMTWFGEQYLRSEADAHHPDASPIVVEDLRELPPAFVLTAEFDPLRDEADAYARRLAEAGVPVEHHVLNGTIHGVMTNPARLSSGEEVWRLLNAWTRTRFAETTA